MVSISCTLLYDGYKTDWDTSGDRWGPKGRADETKKIGDRADEGSKGQTKGQGTGLGISRGP